MFVHTGSPRRDDYPLLKQATVCLISPLKGEFDNAVELLKARCFDVWTKEFILCASAFSHSTMNITVIYLSVLSVELHRGVFRFRPSHLHSQEGREGIYACTREVSRLTLWRHAWESVFLSLFEGFGDIFWFFPSGASTVYGGSAERMRRESRVVYVIGSVAVGVTAACWHFLLCGVLHFDEANMKTMVTGISCHPIELKHCKHKYKAYQSKFYPKHCFYLKSSVARCLFSNITDTLYHCTLGNCCTFRVFHHVL